MLGDEALFFALVESVEFAAVDGGHGFESRNDRRNDGNGQGAAREGSGWPEFPVTITCGLLPPEPDISGAQFFISEVHFWRDSFKHATSNSC